MLNHSIRIEGMKENNLKNIDLTIPKGKIVVFTGVSGSGKSSVVFDTIATESNRQMTLNYSHYVRNQMPRYERPKVDLIQQLSPVIVIEQKAIRSHSSSTVGTYMDLQPLLRLLFSRVGSPRIESALDFSSQSSLGKCPSCNGYGKVIKPDLSKLVDVEKSLREYAVQFKPLSPAGWQGRWMISGGLFDPDKKIKEYSEREWELFIHGPPEGEKVFAPFHTKNGPQPHEWDGLIPRFMRLYVNRDIRKLKQVTKEDVLAMTSQIACHTCFGSGLNPKVLASKINGLNIAQFDQLELTVLKEELLRIDDELGKNIVRQMLPSIEQLIDLGLGYMSLARKMTTLSGGEAQRVKIARQLGSSLNNLIYIFDEPSIGLHPQEIPMLIHMMQGLKKQNNTVLVVEHDPEIIKIADEVIEMGPEAGAKGGRVVYQGPPEALYASSGQTNLGRRVCLKKRVRKGKDFFRLENANRYNLKNLRLQIPKRTLVSICGVSGSGKSTLLLEEFLNRYPEAIWINQDQIGISSRSTLATYMGIMDDIRQVFFRETRQKPGMFSFNSLGACPACKGKGMMQPDLAFADPVSITCEACHGTKYSKEALSFTYRGLTIAEVLDLTIAEIGKLFHSEKILHRARTLEEVGLEYVTLGQTTNTLSGGELQRLKLASHLQHKGNIYLLDEPSIGLHQRDNQKLLSLLERLVEAGNSVIIIEHHLDFLASSDWLIELGPKAGEEGGYLLFEGRPADMLEADTPTAQCLKRAILT